jgi:hypothetical protein
MNPERWNRIRQIYQSALECEPQRQESFLKKACAANEALLKEVATHV